MGFRLSMPQQLLISNIDLRGSSAGGGFDEALLTRLESLREAVRRHEWLYFVKAAPEISDLEFDSLFAELKKLEELHPELVTPDSPTQRVGGVATSFETVMHRVPMLSIDNSYSEADIADWMTRIEKIAGRSVFPIVAELKIDGVSATLHYSEGVFRSGATRGDGEVGDLITANLKTIRRLPLRIRSGRDLDIRGEVYITKARLAELNAERVSRGEEAFKNTRNLTAGTLKSLDPSVAASRGLGLMVYGVAQALEVGFKSHYEVLEFLAANGFAVNSRVKKCSNLTEVLEFIHAIDHERESLDFEIDGVVLKVDDLALQQELGATAKAPRWAVAFKYAQQQAVSRIKDVVWQVGRSQLTPVALLEPVELGGTTVSRASLHNLDVIREKGIMLFDPVLVEKAGYIIPYVVKPLTELRRGDERQILPPSHCPSCGGDVEANEAEGVGTVVRCVSKSCLGTLSRRVSHFVTQLEIEFIGSKIVDRVIEEGLINNVSDLTALSVEDLMKIDRMGEKVATKIVSSIAAASKAPLSRLIAGFGIENIGAVVAGSIASELFPTGVSSLDDLQHLTVDQLRAVSGVEEKTGSRFVEFFAAPANRDMLNRIGQWWKGPDPDPASQNRKATLAGLTFVVTGEATVPRRSIEGLIKNCGGKVSSSVSAKTGRLVIGSKESVGFSSSKKSRAESLKIPIINEFELETLADDSLGNY